MQYRFMLGAMALALLAEAATPAAASAQIFDTGRPRVERGDRVDDDSDSDSDADSDRKEKKAKKAKKAKDKNRRGEWCRDADRNGICDTSSTESSRTCVDINRDGVCDIGRSTDTDARNRDRRSPTRGGVILGPRGRLPDAAQEQLSRVLQRERLPDAARWQLSRVLQRFGFTRGG